MKKLFTLILVTLLVVLVLAGCGDGNGSGIEFTEPPVANVPSGNATDTPPSDASAPVAISGEATTISAGRITSYAILSDGSLWAWGDASELVSGESTGIQTNPIWIMDDVVSVSMGRSHTVAIRTDRSLWYWGSVWAHTGGLHRVEFTPIMSMENVIAVSAGGSHTVAVQTDNNLRTWGSNWHGQLGGEESPILHDVVAVSAGCSYTMAIRSDGSLWAWGNNDSGQLGDGTTINRDAPVWIMNDVVAVSTGGSSVIAPASSYTMAIRSDGSLWAWGSNWLGRLGDGTATIMEAGFEIVENNDRHSPVKIMDNVVAVSAGDNHTMAIRSDSSLWAWGSNAFGQLGDGTTTAAVQHSPIKIMDNVVSVSAGDRHTLALRNDGSLWAWGMNNFGQLGDGTTIDRHEPVRIMDSVKLP